MENLDAVKEAMGAKRSPKKKDTSVTPEALCEHAVITEPITAEEPTVDEVVDEVVDNCEQSSFPGCNTCRNFGSFPAWQPCADCRHNPKNQNSFYQS